MHRRETTPTNSIVKRIMGYTTMSGTPPAIKWGIEKESVARAAYIMRMQQCGHKDIQCSPTGLTLMPQHSYIGASGDGVISGHRHHSDKGVLEIKCPYSIQGNIVYDMSPLQIAQKYPKNFFLEHIDSKLQLKRSSNYYYQVQGEMAVMDIKWCHFVVWTNSTSNNLFIEEIEFDHNLWSSIIFPKLQTFYLSTVVPEVLCHTVQQEMT